MDNEQQSKNRRYRLTIEEEEQLLNKRRKKQHEKNVKKQIFQPVKTPLKRFWDPQNENQRNVLIIGDLHAPFVKPRYLEHCKHVFETFNCTQAILIGDVVDNHYSSYHETDPDGMSAKDELIKAVEMLQPFHEAFPNAKVMIGNHDRIIMRKMYSAGVSKTWIKDYKDVLQCPSWEFMTEFEQDGVLYIHGEEGGGINGALTKAMNRRKSIVQGHWHTEASIRWNVSSLDRLFAMNVGCGIDDKAYSFAYAKFNIKKSIISCGVVVDNGRLPVIFPMEL